MRFINILLVVALLFCDYQHYHNWYQKRDRRDHVLSRSSIFVSATTDQPVIPYCPYFGSSCLQTYDQNLAYTNTISNTTHPTCCKRCDSKPETMGWCSEIMPCEDDVTDDVGHDRACIRTTSELYDIGVLAVATCAGRNIDQHYRRCVQRYTTDGSYTVDTYDVMPVRDIITGTLYRNIHCAICNGRDITDVKFWELNVECLYTSNLKLATDSNVLNVVEGAGECYFVFKDPEPSIRDEECSTAVAKCNETGNWVENFDYDPMDLQRCLTGARYVVESFGVLYKNDACLSCNGPFMNGVPQQTLDNPSFSMLLRIGDREKDASSHPSSCGGGMVFHRPKKQCVEARCSLLRQLRGGVCERTVPNPDSFAYRISFRITPKERSQNDTQRAALDVQTGYEIFPALGKQLKKLILSVFPSTTRIVYEMVLVGDIEYYSEKFNFSELLQADLAFFELRIKLVNTESHDPEQKLTELIGLEDELALNIDQRNISFKLRLQDGRLYFRHNGDPSRMCSFTFGNFYPCPHDTLKESSIKTYPLDNNLTAVPISGVNLRGISEYFFKTSVSTERSILELRECPFVKVSKLEMYWVETELGVEFRIGRTTPVNASVREYGESSDSRRIPLKASEYVYGLNLDILWMCLETHEKLIDSRSASLAVYSRADIVWTTLLISIVMFFKTDHS